jgi:hypothetical protein
MAEERKKNVQAKELRQKIDRLIGGGSAQDGKQESDQKPQSPRDFIHRRMRELDRNGKKQ